MLLPYRRYFDFSGRSRRREFWLFGLFCWLVTLGIELAFGMPMAMRMGGMFTAQTVTGGFGMLLVNLFGLFNLIPTLAVWARRLHDIDRSAWWSLLVFVPMLGWLVLLVFFCLDGTYGSNRYGFDPKGRGAGDVFS